MGCPLVSVIVPVYNSELFLKECIESIVTQTYSNIEVLLIDDGSTDSSLQVCEQFCRNDERITIYSLKHSGPANARNFALTKCSGEYLLFVDSDDLLNSQCIQRCMQHLSRFKTSIVAFQYARISVSGEISSANRTFPIGLYGLKDSLGFLLKEKDQNYIWNIFCKRNIWHDIVFPSQCLMEDLSVKYRLYLNADNVLYVSDVLYYYRYNPKSIVNSPSIDNLVDFRSSYFERNQFIANLFPELADYAQIQMLSVNCQTILMSLKFSQSTVGDVQLDSIDYISHSPLRFFISLSIRHRIIYCICRFHLFSFVKYPLYFANRIYSRYKLQHMTKR